MLIETLTSESDRNFKHIFLTGPDIVEFNETVKPLNQEDTFLLFPLSHSALMRLCKAWLCLKRGLKPNVNSKIAL